MQSAAQPVLLDTQTSKYQTNISIASFLPYSVGDLYPTVVMEDFLMQMAVNEINEDPAILPNTYVNFVRYNNWDPDLSADWPIYTSAGAAMVAAIDTAESGVSKLAETMFTRAGITIITKVALTDNMFENHDYTQQYKNLRDVDARYSSFK
ncbi:hypothetical protein HDU76_002752 [Blyttiomyces sp. JEL0837]|nr:hypothetical protein HDU76_002752 [Blyttiomyces sp. JEL0837]